MKRLVSTRAATFWHSSGAGGVCRAADPKETMMPYSIRVPAILFAALMVTLAAVPALDPSVAAPSVRIDTM